MQRGKEQKKNKRDRVTGQNKGNKEISNRAKKRKRKNGKKETGEQENKKNRETGE